MMDLQQVAAATGGQLIGTNVAISSVDSDSRRVQPGMLFVALLGEKFDGHDFIQQVASQGAVAALVSKPVTAEIPCVQVDDTRLAMGQLAYWWRQQMGLPLIAVTGSNGKTTTKEMIAAILQTVSPAEDSVLATAGNYNNDIGMPLTLLRLRPHHRYAVIEMGMNHLGEIDYLTRLARPDVAVINNAGTAHIGELGSRENIAKAKGEIFAGLGHQGVAVINQDSPFADYWRGLNTQRRIVSFGTDMQADVRGEWPANAADGAFLLHVDGQSLTVQLQVPGEHNRMNALAAAAACLAIGAPVQAVVAGLNRFGGVKGRLQFKRTRQGAMLIDDTYNANPDSMRAALEVLRTYAQPTWFVMGDMGELGDDADQMHEQIGAYAKQCGITHFYTLGQHAQRAAQAYGAGAHHFSEVADLIATLASTVTASSVVLVKGSRFMRMERVVNGLTEAHDA